MNSTRVKYTRIINKNNVIGPVDSLLSVGESVSMFLVPHNRMWCIIRGWRRPLMASQGMERTMCSQVDQLAKLPHVPFYWPQPISCEPSIDTGIKERVDNLFLKNLNKAFVIIYNGS